MRIYMVMTVLAPIGGIESSLVPLAVELKRQGHDVVVWTIEPIVRPNQNAEGLEAAGIIIQSVPYRWYQAVAALKPRWLTMLRAIVSVLLLPVLGLIAVDALIRRRSFGRSWRGAHGKLFGRLSRHYYVERLYYWHLRPLLKSAENEQVAHLHGWGCGEDPPNGARWLRERGIATTYTEHNSPDLALTQPIADAPMNDVDVLIAVSQASKAGLEQVGLATRPIEVIPYSVAGLPPATVQKSAENAFTILCFARLHPQKGQADLIDAMPAMLHHVPNTRLWFAGAGELRNQLEEQVVNCQLNDYVSFLGLVTHDQLPNLLAEADVVVLPSYWEGLPVSLIEALSAGKACVVTGVGGSPELIRDGENGIVVPPHRPDLLAQALVTLAQDGSMRKRFEQASMTRFASGEFSPQTVTNQTLLAYRKAMVQNERRVAHN